MLKIALADDEAAARTRLRRLLKNEDGVELIGEYADGDALLAAMPDLNPDVLLLDVEMPGADGLTVARQLSVPGGPVIVFVTAFDRYALEAFEVHALDYLVKPVDAERLHTVIERIRKDNRREAVDLAAVLDQLRAQRERTENQPRRHRERLLVNHNGRIVVVPAAEVDWIEAAGNYVKIHWKGTTLLLRESLNALENELDPAAFGRAHRAAIVNLNRIREMQPWFSGSHVLILASGEKLRLSRSYRRPFLIRFTGSEDIE